MKEVKLSEVKVGDQIYDLENNSTGLQTLLEVTGFEPGAVLMKVVSGDPYLVSPVRFSTYTNESFYKPKN